MKKVKFALFAILTLGLFSLSACADNNITVVPNSDNEEVIVKDTDLSDEEPVVYDDVSFKYTLDSTTNSYSIAIDNEKDNSNVKGIVIPDNYNGLPVTKIAEKGFAGLEKLKSVVIPNTVTTISDYAFQNCINLRNLTLPNNITCLANKCFYKCVSLYSVTLPATLTEIDSYAFDSCHRLVEIYNLSSIDITGHKCIMYVKKLHNNIDEESIVKKCGNYIVAYYDDAYNILDYLGQSTKVVLPSGFIIGDNQIDQYKTNSYWACTTTITELKLSKAVTSFKMFSYLHDFSAIEKISVDENNPKYDSRNNCNAIIITSTNSLAFGCKNTFVPEGVLKISADFDGCEFDNFNIPDSVESISSTSFNNAVIKNFVTYNGGHYLGNSTNPYYFCFGCDQVTTLELHEDCKILCDGRPKNVDSLIISRGIKSITRLGRYSSVTYQGTKEEWEEITKTEDWWYNLQATTITCSNGNIDVPTLD